MPDSNLPFKTPQTVGDAISLYLAHAQHEQSARTFDDRRRVLNEFCTTHGQIALAEAKPFHLLLWIDSHRERWRSEWTRSRVIGSVLRAMNWAVKLGIIDRNPFKGVSRQAGERGEPMELADFQAMLRVSSAVFRRLLIFLRFSGARPGEASNAEWRHLDAARACVELSEHKTAKKTKRPRRIMLHPVLMKLIDWIRRHRPHEKYILVNAKRCQWKNSAICWRIKWARERAGIKPGTTCYCLRHLYAVQAVLNDVDVATLMPLMGHTRVETTMYYADVAKKTDHLQSAVAKIFKKR